MISIIYTDLVTDKYFQRFLERQAGQIQGEDRKKWPPMKIGFLDYNCVKRAENVEKFINRTVQLPNMTEGLTLLNLKCNLHHTNR